MNPYLLETAFPVNLVDPVNRQHPLNWGRVGWWQTVAGLDGGKFWYDLLGLYPGTLTNMDGSSGWRGTTRPGGTGHLLYDGANDYVDVGKPLAVTKTTPFSGAIWAKTTGVAATALLSNWDVTATPGWRLDMLGTGELRFLLTNAGATAGRVNRSNTTINDGAWHRVGWSFDGTTAIGLVLYIDGIAPTATNIFDTDPGTLTNVNTWVGAALLSGASAINWNGALDDATLWNRALSASEMRADYEISRFGYPGAINRLGPIAAMTSAAALSLFRRALMRRAGSRTALTLGPRGL